MVQVKKDYVSIIIVTWNSEKFIKDCLSTIIAQSYKKFEIIVVDNGSTDKTLAIIDKHFKKDVILIRNENNAGFCAANNRGLEEARGEFVLFLNPDTKMEKDYLGKAVREFSEQAVGAVSGKLLRFDRKTVDSAGQFLGRDRRAVERGYNRPDAPEYNTKGRCFSVCGAAALYRRSVVEEIKINGQFFDERYFAFFEDLDSGWRMNLAGYYCVYQPDAVVYHHRGGSGKGGTGLKYQITARRPEIQAAIIRNRWFTILKNDSFYNYILDFPFILLREIKTCGYLILVRRDIFRSVYGGFFRNLKDTLKTRKMILSESGISPRQLRRRFLWKS